MLSLVHLFKRDKGICFLCKKQVYRKDASRDHIWPREFGGPDIRFNLRLTHKSCNKNRVVDDFWKLMRVEDECWIFEGEPVHWMRLVFRPSGKNLQPICGSQRCVRPDHLVEL